MFNLRDIMQGFAHDGPRPDSDLGMGEIEAMFWAHSGNVVHKWHHYLPIYDLHFAKWKHRAPRLLEIGVSKGGSMDLWRKFFGPEAVIFGIDITPACAKLDGAAAQIRIGSQADPAFLARVIDEMGGVDIVIDDGSHKSSDVNTSLNVLFPLLSVGGTYIAEDLHASYWTAFQGGYRRSGTSVERFKNLIDDMHHWYHGQPVEAPQIGDQIAAMHVYDSMIVLEKGLPRRPLHTQVGQA